MYNKWIQRSEDIIGCSKGAMAGSLRSIEVESVKPGGGVFGLFSNLVGAKEITLDNMEPTLQKYR